MTRLANLQVGSKVRKSLKNNRGKIFRGMKNKWLKKCTGVKFIHLLFSAGVAAVYRAKFVTSAACTNWFPRYHLLFLFIPLMRFVLVSITVASRTSGRGENDQYSPICTLKIYKVSLLLYILRLLFWVNFF